MTLEPKTNTTILLDIYERLGTIEEQLRGLTKSHDLMDKELVELKEFKSKVGAYIWLGGFFVTGALTMLWHGAVYMVGKWFH